MMDRDVYFEKVKGLLCIGFDYCTSINYDAFAESYEEEIDECYNDGLGPEIAAQQIIDIEKS